MEEEGEFRESQLTWGFHMDFNLQSTQLPHPKCVKSSYLLAVPELQPGVRQVPMKLVHELHGTINYCVISQPHLLPEMPSISRMLSQLDMTSKFANPHGSPLSVELAWVEWDEMLEYLRVLFGDADQWTTNFTSAFHTCLSLPELMAMPKVAHRPPCHSLFHDICSSPSMTGDAMY